MKEYRFQELKVGLTETFNVTLEERMLEAFCNLSGDHNPLHSSADYAHAKGFKGCVAHGLLMASFYSRLVGVYLPGKHALLHGIDVAFHAPGFAGDTLQVTGQVTYLNEAYRQVEIKARIVNQSNQKLSDARIKVGLYE